MRVILLRNPLLFSETLPCFKIANKDGRLDYFPIETCYVVINKVPHGLSQSVGPSSPSSFKTLHPSITNQQSNPPPFQNLSYESSHSSNHHFNFNHIFVDGKPQTSSTSTTTSSPPSPPFTLSSPQFKSYSNHSTVESKTNSLVVELAKKYRLFPSSTDSPHECTTAEELCRFNGQVATDLKANHLAIIWHTVANLLSSGKPDSESDHSDSDSDIESESSSDSDENDDDDDDEDENDDDDDDDDDEEEDEDGISRNNIKKEESVHVSTSAALAMLSPYRTRKNKHKSKQGSFDGSRKIRIARNQTHNKSGHHVSSDGTSLSWLLVKSVRELLIERCHCGDVQTCVAVCTVLKEVKHFSLTPSTSSSASTSYSSALSSSSSLAEIVSTSQQRHEWTWCYIEYLRILHLHVQANELCKKSENESTSQINTNSTSIYAACASCKKPIITSSTRYLCTKCKAMTSMCVLCREPVRGLFAVCPGCGHGGHLNHLKTWFRDQSTCPSGCGHICDINTFGLGN